MKGDISLGDFIKKVKRELVTAQDKAGTAFFELKEVELEVSFVLDAKASAEGQLMVVKLGGETKATQTHKVVMKFLPLPQSAPALLPTGSCLFNRASIVGRPGTGGGNANQFQRGLRPVEKRRAEGTMSVKVQS